MHQRRAWKSEGNGSGFLSGGALWGAPTFDPRRVLVQVPAVTRGPREHELMYVLQTETFVGLFTFDWDKDRERRVMHRSQMLARDITHHPTEPLIAYALWTETGAARIVVASDEHGDVREVTEGDSVDEAPAWVPGHDRMLVYQSAGIGRSAGGWVGGVGPAAIFRLDLVSGVLEEVAHDPSHDLLQPRFDAAGRLWFIRRPYQRAKPPGVLRLLQDIVLFPFRLARAIYHFLNFISLAFSQKPLSSAGAAPAPESLDAGQLVIRGRLVDARKALRSTEKLSEPPAVVPKSWQLVCVDDTGEEEIVARGIVAFDLADDGTVVWTNGMAIFEQRPAGPARLLERGKLIEGVSFLAAA